MLGVLKYFHCVNNNSRKDLDKEVSLPDPDDKLSKKIPSSLITYAMVNKVLEKPCGKRGAYLALTPAQKYSVGKCAAEKGITTTNCYILCQGIPRYSSEGDISMKDEE